jgi:hypothetical protein
MPKLAAGSADDLIKRIRLLVSRNAVEDEREVAAEKRPTLRLSDPEAGFATVILSSWHEIVGATRTRTALAAVRAIREALTRSIRNIYASYVHSL